MRSMSDTTVLFDLPRQSADRNPDAIALTYGTRQLSYAELQQAITGFSDGLLSLGIGRGERVGIYLEKRFETVIASHYRTFPLLAQDASVLKAGLPDVKVIEPEVMKAIEFATKEKVTSTPPSPLPSP